MNLQASNPFSLQLRSTFAERQPAAVVPMYTPLWYATRVMSVTANSWWDGGVPPARRRGQRAADAVAHAAVGVARRLHAVRSGS
jgi:hypothetical protein